MAETEAEWSFCILVGDNQGTCSVVQILFIMGLPFCL